MTVQTSSPGTGSPDTAPSATTDVATAKARPSRARPIAVWSVVVVLTALVATWLLAGFNPALSPTGFSWQGPEFVEQKVPGATDDQEKTWTAWDTESGAWASVLVRNTRPYPVTVSPASVGNVVEVQVAAYDYPEAGGLISPEAVTPAASLEVPSGGYVVVLLHVSDRCVEMMAGGATGGSDVATVNVTTLGITHSLDIPFPATYLAGTTTDHMADPSCTTD